MKTDTIEDVLGYEPSDDQLRMILRAATEKSIPVLEAAAAFAMPEICICDPDGTFEYKGQRYDKETFAARHPYRKFVIIY